MGDDGGRRARIVCVANQKGGVGKTTTAVSLAAVLGMEGLAVLLVDLDPQGNATTGLGARVPAGGYSVYDVLMDGVALTDAVRPTAVDGLDILPSALDLAGAEIELVPGFSREARLSRALEPQRGDYDVVILDCPPSLGLLTVNAMASADQLLVPIQAEYYALEGVSQLLRTVELVREGLNPGLSLLGVVLTMFDGRTRLAHEVAEEVRGHFGATTFRTVIPRAVRLSEAPGYGQPIATYDPTSRGARAYRRLAEEVAERLGVTLSGSALSPLQRLLAAVEGAGDESAGHEGDRSGVDTGDGTVDRAREATDRPAHDVEATA